MSLLAIAVLVYCVLALWPWRTLTGHFAWWMVEHWFKHQSKPDVIDWVSGALAAAFCVLAWPLIVPVVLLARFLPRAPKIGAERRAAKRRLETETANIEKDLGLNETDHPEYG